MVTSPDPSKGIADPMLVHKTGDGALHLTIEVVMVYGA